MKKQSGFSLMEILIALVILALLGSIVLQSFGDNVTEAKYLKLKSDFQSFENALERFYNDNGFYPTSEQGLEALVTKPDSSPEPTNYPSKGYIKRIEKTPWNNDYLYLSPAEFGEGEYEIISLGADNEEGGEDQKTDVTNWNIAEVLEAMKEKDK
ncbi:type II secretion system major pseudopilin GspG [Pleionea sp. CnH1-48]|uniref:type II secretion system major pseudopilin GspG n=1 Tax=Pleionea sp. CnH1-48 TaxID=2954494 RepID=UPI002097172A|nr:type II secretion system major pseudopilin GspG [Pleionea sp. CnH1-48]